jgi:dihydrofolate synthase/folylpolyglutamate synthase
MGFNLPGIEYLKTLSPWTGKGGFGLDAIKRAAEAWGNPQDSVKSIHVTGTNGKGSVCAYLATILGYSGKKVGLTTSPHLSRMNERLIFDGLPIGDDELSGYGLVLHALLKRHSIELSFFEAITLIFFHACRERKLDWMVVEVGLGGRTDATNIIGRPEVCCVTTIDLEHQDILGDSLDKIAREKGGIVKAGCSLVIGERKDSPRNVLLEIAKNLGVRAQAIERDFGWRAEVGNDAIEFWNKSESRGSFTPGLRGRYQFDNAAVAFAAAELMAIEPAVIARGIANTRWPGRLEELSIDGRYCLLDAGHNPAGILSLTNYLKENNITSVELGFGVLRTKNWKEMVNELLPFVSSWNLLKPDAGPAVEPEEIADYLSSLGISSQCFGQDYAAFFSSMAGRKISAPLLLTGSIYLIGKLREYLVKQDKPMW